jgi:hypothetical protein
LMEDALGKRTCGRPRGRRVEPKPRRRAVVSIQDVTPYGALRRAPYAIQLSEM